MMKVLQIVLWALVLFLGVLMALVVYVPHHAEKYMYEKVSDIPTTTVAMVLGASVKTDGTLSPILRERADRGGELYLKGKVMKILVSGDNSDLTHNEVNPVGKYLEAMGIPKHDIFLDHAGFDTYSSMYRAKEVFGVTDVVIVSQPFHLARAVLIARELGLNAHGMPAGSGVDLPYNTLREIPATVKALFDLWFARVPKFLGPEHDIHGDGTETWE